MAKKNLKISGILAAVVLILLLSGIAAFLFHRLQNFKSEVNALKKEARFAQAYDQWQHNLRPVDSLILRGDFQSALQKLNRWSDSLPDDQWQERALRARLKTLEQWQSRQGEGLHLQEQLVKSEEKHLERLDGLRDSIQSAKDQFLKEKSAMLSNQHQLRGRLKELENRLENIRQHRYISFRSSKGGLVYYLGETHKGKAHGQGVGIWLTGSKYEGQWRNNMRHGQGVFEWPDGDRYEGEFRNDNRHGKGTYYWGNGEKYIGQWRNDKRNGEGTFYGKDDQVIAKGRWENDELVSPAAP